MEIAAYISIAFILSLFVGSLVGRYLGMRARPHCPVHDKPMELIGDMDYEEYVCRVKGCMWCADVYDDGKVKIFKV